jgi:hypothetical protein
LKAESKHIDRLKELRYIGDKLPARVLLLNEFSTLLKCILAAISALACSISEVQMGQKRIMIFSCFAVLVIGVFTIGRNSSSKSVSRFSPPQAYAIPTSPAVSDDVAYDFLFRKVVRIREKTRELQSQGRIGPEPYFVLQKEAGLNRVRSTALEAIALACQQEVAKQDQRAMAIVKAYQLQFRAGRVPAGGHPPLPPELKAMWEERNAIVLRARDRLRSVFGEEAFAHFDDYVKFYYGTNKSPVSIKPAVSKSK